MSDTSTESYEKCNADGLIGDRQLRVMQFILAFQSVHPDGVSRGDVALYFNDTRTGYSRRVQELEVAGLLVCVGTKLDTKTGRTVKAYKPTGKIPTERVVSTVPQHVRIRVWWWQDDECQYGPFFNEADATAAIEKCGPGEIVSKIIQAEKA
jgi:hypothetical protein